jgi:heat shock protein HslJ
MTEICFDTPMIPHQKAFRVLQFVTIASSLACIGIGADNVVAQHPSKTLNKTASSKMTSSAKRPNGTWTLATWTENRQTQSLLSKQAVTLQFSEDKVSGFASCNNYQGFVKWLSQTNVQVGSLATTRKLCRPDVMNQERRFLKALQSAQSVTVTSNQIKVQYKVGQGTGDLVFNAAKGSKNTTLKSSLQNTDWILTRWSLGNTINRPLDTTQVTARFSSDRITGSAGCNQFQGGYSQTEQQLIIKDLIATEKGCEPSLMKQETAVLAALAGSQSSTLDANGQLNVAYKVSEGSGIMTFVPLVN